MRVGMAGQADGDVHGQQGSPAVLQHLQQRGLPLGCVGRGGGPPRRARKASWWGGASGVGLPGLSTWPAPTTGKGRGIGSVDPHPKLPSLHLSIALPCNWKRVHLMSNLRCNRGGRGEGAPLSQGERGSVAEAGAGVATSTGTILGGGLGIRERGVGLGQRGGCLHVEGLAAWA